MREMLHLRRVATVSWGGANLGMLTSVQVRAGRSQLVDVTSVNATVLGSGTNSRVLRGGQVASVEPASVSLTAYSTLNHCEPE